MDEHNDGVPHQLLSGSGAPFISDEPDALLERARDLVDEDVRERAELAESEAAQAEAAQLPHRENAPSSGGIVWATGHGSGTDDGKGPLH